MGLIKPIVKAAAPDSDGRAHQDRFDAIDARLKNEPRRVYHVLADGYQNAISVDDEYMIYETYRGTSGRNYDRYRKANPFEAHLLRKIEGLNKFFIE